MEDTNQNTNKIGASGVATETQEKIWCYRCDNSASECTCEDRGLAPIWNQPESEKMDELVAVGNQEGFAENAKGMVADLKTEGFENDEIESYLRTLIRRVMY